MKDHSERANEEVGPESYSCSHCKELTYNPIRKNKDGEDYVFCCQGCDTVHSLLISNGLEEYYRFRDLDPNSQLSPVRSKNVSYEYLNHKDFQNEYVKINGRGQKQFLFYLEGIHCYACLWLIEKLPLIFKSLVSSELQFGKSLVTLTFNKDESQKEIVALAEVAKELASLGYAPHPVKSDNELEQMRKLEERRDILKIGIAGAMAGNIMIYSVSQYGGAEGGYSFSFGLICLALFLPVLFYSAKPFYQSSLRALKNRTINLDVPIVIALILGLFHGPYEIFIKNVGHHYFDTLSILIFLLLLNRYFVKKFTDKGLSAKDNETFFSPKEARRLNSQNGEWETIPSTSLIVGDVIEINPGEVISIDGEVVTGKSYVNNSLLTGESRPLSIENGDQVFAGATNQGGKLQVKIIALKNDTKLAEIYRSFENLSKNKLSLTMLADQRAKHLITAVLSISFIVLLITLYTGEYEAGFQKILALIIITCPCALGLATPLALSLSLGEALKRGIVIKNENVIEKIAFIKNIFLDKTGTLTYGDFTFIGKKNFERYESDADRISYILEEHSTHPIAIALTEALTPDKSYQHLKLENRKEITGKGVYGEVNGQKYFIGRAPENNTKNGLSISLYTVSDEELNGKKEITRYHFEDSLRPEGLHIINKLKAMGKNIFILSGDSKVVTKHIGEKLGLLPTQCEGELTPEQKAKFIDYYSAKECLVVGDGANDALAMAKASLAISVRGSMELGLKASDVYFTKQGLSPLLDLFNISKQTLKTIKRNLNISLCYNLIGISLSLMGFINPLTAAILMPLSSIAVVISTVIGKKQINRHLVMPQKASENL
jgi:heavy metal translocating P-type ATPase